MSTLLMEAVIDALAKGWSVPVESVARIPDQGMDKKDLRREVGTLNGRPIYDTVDIIRAPQEEKERLVGSQRKGASIKPASRKQSMRKRSLSTGRKRPARRR